MNFYTEHFISSRRIRVNSCISTTNIYKLSIYIFTVICLLYIALSELYMKSFPTTGSSPSKAARPRELQGQALSAAQRAKFDVNIKYVRSLNFIAHESKLV